MRSENYILGVSINEPKEAFIIRVTHKNRKSKNNKTRKSEKEYILVHRQNKEIKYLIKILKFKQQQ